MNAIAKWHMSEISKYEEDFRVGGEPEEYPPMLKWHMEEVRKAYQATQELQQENGRLQQEVRKWKAYAKKIISEHLDTIA